jgi:hypothetical protein
VAIVVAIVAVGGVASIVGYGYIFQPTPPPNPNTTATTSAQGAGTYHGTVTAVAHYSFSYSSNNQGETEVSYTVTSPFCLAPASSSACLAGESGTADWTESDTGYALIADDSCSASFQTSFTITMYANWGDALYQGNPPKAVGNPNEIYFGVTGPGYTDNLYEENYTCTPPSSCSGCSTGTETSSIYLDPWIDVKLPGSGIQPMAGASVTYSCNDSGSGAPGYVDCGGGLYYSGSITITIDSMSAT